MTSAANDLPHLPHATPGQRHAATFVAVLLGWWTLFAVVAWLSPLHGGDWQRAAWIDAHGFGPAALAKELAVHFDLGEVLALLAVASPIAHALLAASAATALLLALACHVLGRWPDPRAPGDALALVLTGALVWLALPSPGALLYHRSTVGLHVVGLAGLAWLLAAYRFAPPVAPGGELRALNLVVAGAAVGACTAPPVGVAAAVLLAIGVIRRWRRGPVPAWMWTGAAALLACALLRWGAGGVAGSALARVHDLDRFTRSAGDVFALTALAALLWLWRAPAGAPPGLSCSRVLWLIGLAAAVALLGRFGAGSGDATLIAPMLPLVVAATMVLYDLTADPWLRRVLVISALAVHLVVAGQSLAVYVQVHHDFQARMAQLLGAPVGGVAKVAAYRTEPGAFFAGEDFNDVGVRATAAARFGLAEIELATRVKSFVPAQPYDLVALRAGEAPIVLTRHLATARQQLAALQAVQLVVEVRGFDFDARRGRPVIAARVDDSQSLVPDAVASDPDRFGVASFVVRTPDLAAHPEVHVVHDGTSLPLERHGQTISYRPTDLGHHGLVACDANECLLVETRYIRP